MILPVSCSINLDFDNKKVWQIISEPGNLNKTHPFCKSNTVVKWDKDNHEDILEYLNGVILHRNFYQWDEGKGYELNIGRKNGIKIVDRIVLEELNGKIDSENKLWLIPK